MEKAAAQKLECSWKALLGKSRFCRNFYEIGKISKVSNEVGKMGTFNIKNCPTSMRAFELNIAFELNF